MAELKVQVDNSSTLAIPTYAVTNAVLKNIYIYNINNVTAVAGGYNYLSIENTAGSGKSVIILGCFVSVTSAAATTASNPLVGRRASALSGGTTIAASSIVKADTTKPNPTATVRTTNPTATLGGTIFSYPPPVSAGAVFQAPFAVNFGAVPGGFLLADSEGMVIRTQNDDVNRDWNISLLWGEI